MVASCLIVSVNGGKCTVLVQLATVFLSMDVTVHVNLTHVKYFVNLHIPHILYYVKLYVRTCL